MDLLRKDLLQTDDKDFADDAQNWQSKYNITQINPHLYVGGAIINKRMMDTLESLGVDGVICAAEEECQETAKRAKRAGVRAFLMMMEDTAVTPTPDWRDFVAAWDWYEDLYRRHLMHGRCFPTIYVHCHAGMHRGPTTAAFLLAKLCCVSLKDAIELIIAVRPVAHHVHSRPELLGAAKRALTSMGGDHDDDGD